jgi:hypothetical protein
MLITLGGAACTPIIGGNGQVGRMVIAIKMRGEYHHFQPDYCAVKRLVPNKRPLRDTHSEETV